MNEYIHEKKKKKGIYKQISRINSGQRKPSEGHSYIHHNMQI